MSPSLLSIRDVVANGLIIQTAESNLNAFSVCTTAFSVLIMISSLPIVPYTLEFELTTSCLILCFSIAASASKMETSGGTEIIGEDIISSSRVRAGDLCNETIRYKISVLDTKPIISFFESDTKTERTERSRIAAIASAAV